MSTASTHTLTRLLHAWSEGDPDAAEDLLPLVYEELRGLAGRHMRGERADHVLQPTALVHEAYLRLADGAAVPWRDRLHFYSVASRAMRRILVDHARARRALCRGGQQQRVPLEHAATVVQPAEQIGEADFVALDAALDRLTETYGRPGQVVELRFFGRMEFRDIAALLQVTERTVMRDWRLARLWLHRELGKTSADHEC